MVPGGSLVFVIMGKLGFPKEGKASEEADVWWSCETRITWQKKMV